MNMMISLQQTDSEQEQSVDHFRLKSLAIILMKRLSFQISVLISIKPLLLKLLFLKICITN